MSSHITSVCENLNIITARNLRIGLNDFVDFLNNSNIEVIIYSAKTDKTADISLIISNESLAETLSQFKQLSSPHTVIAVRGGICHMNIDATKSGSNKLLAALVNYFYDNGIDIERVVTTEKEVRIFFPALEVCGCLAEFTYDLESFLQTY